MWLVIGGTSVMLMGPAIAQIPISPQPGTGPAGSNKPSSGPAGLSDAQEVRNLQQALKDRGMHPGPVDGIMSRETQASIRAFQKAQKVPVTGRLDSQTREKLGMVP
jgi:peptidoglycan hydrolase-like protein with peptidoglycan-binding domain